MKKIVKIGDKDTKLEENTKNGFSTTEKYN